MIKLKSLPSLSALALTLVAATPAHALSNRAWVSGHGTDAAGCGAPTSPCRSFQYVHDNIIAAGGEIDVLDPAGYGTITITKALSIVNDGVGTAGVQQPTTEGNAITINAGASDTVVLRGLEIEGLGVAQIGVWLQQAGSLSIANCVVRHFTGRGMYINPQSGVTNVLIENSTASDNSGEGIILRTDGSATMNSVVRRTTVAHNGNGGIVVLNTGSGASNATVVDSIAFNNLAESLAGGFEAVLNGATLRLQRSVAAHNNYGVVVQSGGIVESFGDNDLRGNVSGPVGGTGGLTTVSFQ